MRKLGCQRGGDVEGARHAKICVVSRVLVLFGGRSPEHSISCLSAHTVTRALTDAGHTVLTVGIRQDGRWTRSDVPVASGDALPKVGDGPTCSLVMRATGVALVTFTNDGDAIAASEPVDVVFPVLHGAGGEDGSIQGFCETVGVAYVGADVAASARGVDKVAMKQDFAAAGLPQVPFVPVTHRVFRDDADAVVRQIVTELPAPWFVKPACEGSSFGISRVEQAADLPAAITHAFTFGAKVIVEAGLTGARELEVGVIGSDDLNITGPGEIVSAHTFYDFSAKYLTASALHIPADVSDDVATQIRDIAATAYRAIGCRSFARVDFFYVDGELLINEINTIPGFTAHSMFPLLWAHENVPFAELVDQLVSAALATRKAG